jgi:hypothetical protein
MVRRMSSDAVCGLVIFMQSQVLSASFQSKTSRTLGRANLDGRAHHSSRSLPKPDGSS